MLWLCQSAIAWHVGCLIWCNRLLLGCGQLLATCNVDMTTNLHHI